MPIFSRRLPPLKRLSLRRVKKLRSGSGFAMVRRVQFFIPRPAKGLKKDRRLFSVRVRREPLFEAAAAVAAGPGEERATKE
jgi:hypothetical protein